MDEEKTKRTDQNETKNGQYFWFIHTASVMSFYVDIFFQSQARLSLDWIIRGAISVYGILFLVIWHSMENIHNIINSWISIIGIISIIISIFDDMTNLILKENSFRDIAS